MFSYMMFAAYITDLTILQHQGARIAEHLKVKMEFTWEEPFGPCLAVEKPLTPMQVAILNLHYGINVQGRLSV